MTRAALVSAGITFGRHHHGERRVAVPAQIEVLEHAVARGDQRRHQIRHQTQHQHLGFRIAKAHIVFDELRSFGGDHQPGIEHALVGRAHGFHRASVGVMISRMTRAAHGLVDIGRRRIGAHAAGVRSLVAVTDALVILRRGQRDRGLAVAQREEGGFLAVEEFLDDDFAAGFSEPAAEHHVDARLPPRPSSAPRRRLCRRQARRP